MNLKRLHANKHTTSIAVFFTSSSSTSSPAIVLSRRSSLHDVARYDRPAISFRQIAFLHGELVGDPFAITAAIKACVSPSHLPSGRRLHNLCVVSGVMEDPFIESSLLHMYLRCRATKDAHKLFDETLERNVVSWSAMISGYARDGRTMEALSLLEAMKEAGVEPNLVCWNGMIAGLCNYGRPLDAMAVFRRMRSEGFLADGTGISTVLPAAGDARDLHAGKQIHGYAIKCGWRSNACVMSALIDMYGKCGHPKEMVIAFEDGGAETTDDVGSCNALVAGLSRNALADEALKQFRRFRDQRMELNVISWTSIVACCAQNGKDVEALELFKQMCSAGDVEPNSVTIPSMLPACANIAAIKQGKSAHCFSLRKAISEDVYVASALVDMYGKCGRVNDARKVFDAMPMRNVASWNAMLCGYSMHGKVKEATELFKLMLELGQKPDHISFVCVLQSCSQAGHVEEGRCLFKRMKEEFRIAARAEHYACMVTLLGRVGKLQKAHALIQEMDIEPDACIWGSLLSSCRVHSDVILGEIAARKLFHLEPDNAGNYVLLSNIYAAKGMWNGVEAMRTRIKRVGLKKDLGCSWIEVKGNLHMLLAGDRSHPQLAQIVEKLAEIYGEMAVKGFRPSTDFVLHDVEEIEDKEQILHGHSEKLALAFGLINTATGAPLRVIKNLRICGDCHETFKFVSQIERREITVRDTNRFHLFVGGECSCGDFW